MSLFLVAKSFVFNMGILYEQPHISVTLNSRRVAHSLPTFTLSSSLPPTTVPWCFFSDVKKISVRRYCGIVLHADSALVSGSPGMCAPGRLGNRWRRWLHISISCTIQTVFILKIVTVRVQQTKCVLGTLVHGTHLASQPVIRFQLQSHSRVCTQACDCYLFAMVDCAMVDCESMHCEQAKSKARLMSSSSCIWLHSSHSAFNIAALGQ